MFHKQNPTFDRYIIFIRTVLTMGLTMYIKYFNSLTIHWNSLSIHWNRFYTIMKSEELEKKASSLV